MAIDTPDWMNMTQLAAPVQLGIITQANGATVATGTIASIPFQTGWLVVFNNKSIAFAGATLLIEDNVSLQPVISLSATTGDIPAISTPVSGLGTAALLVSMTGLPLNSSGSAITIAYVLGLFGAGVQSVVNSPIQPLYTKEVTDPWSNFLNPLMKVTVVTSNLAAGASFTPITGVVGKTITVYGYDLSIGPVGLVVGGYQALYEDTTAAQLVAVTRINVSTAVGTAIATRTLWIPPGITLPASAGLKVVANAGNVANAVTDGAIFYTQQ